jgi:hypothetical protein
MKTLYLKHLALHLAGLTQAGFGFVTRRHGPWLEGKRKLLLAETYRLQWLARKATLGKPAAIRSAG